MICFARNNTVYYKKGFVVFCTFAFLALCSSVSAAEILCVMSVEGESPEKANATMDLLIKKPELQILGHLFNVTQGSDSGQVSHMGSIRKGPLFSTSKQYTLKVRSGSVLTETFVIDRVTGRYSSRTAGKTGQAIESSGLCRVVPAAKVVF
jgi:hypothetical protein